MTRAEILAIAKPILFNTEMTKAVLDNRKTVTRRVIKPQPQICCDDGFIYDKIANNLYCKGCGNPFINSIDKECMPKYQVGGYLYVRETFCPMEKYFGESNKSEYCYKANSTKLSEECRKQYGIPWSPSIHMPKEAARIFLRVTDIRVERLQDITISQMTSEGIDNTMPSTDCEELCNYCPIPNESKGVHCYGGNPVMCEGRCCSEAFEIWVNIFTDEFASLWDSTIEKQDLDKYGWNANPCVWVIEFERVGTDG